MGNWRSFWAEIWIPSTSAETPYQWALIAFSHAFVAFAIAVLLMVAGLPGGGLPAVLGVSYFALKETRDINHGGARLDSLIDTAFVCLGACVANWPICAPVALGLVALGITFHDRISKGET